MKKLPSIIDIIWNDKFRNAIGCLTIGLLSSFLVSTVLFVLLSFVMGYDFACNFIDRPETYSFLGLIGGCVMLYVWNK